MPLWVSYYPHLSPKTLLKISVFLSPLIASLAPVSLATCSPLPIEMSILGTLTFSSRVFYLSFKSFSSQSTIYRFFITCLFSWLDALLLLKSPDSLEVNCVLFEHIGPSPCTFIHPLFR